MNTKLAVCIHILTMIAFYSDKSITSDFIAKSVNTNPVVIRKFIILFKKKNLIKTHTGKEGGIQLNKPYQQISLYEIIEALENEKHFKRHYNINLNCQVGNFIGNSIDEIFDKGNELINNYFKKITLADILNNNKN